MGGNYHYMFKFVLIGDSGVGKSSIFARFLENRFHYVHDVTVTTDLGSRTIDVRDKATKLQIWDTAGSEQFRAMTRNYFRAAAGVLVIFDVTNKQSFKALDQWIEDVIAQSSAHRNTPIVVVGNKVDAVSKRQVQKDEANAYCKAKGYIYCEASARSKEGVDEAFTKLAEVVYDKIDARLISPEGESSGVRLDGFYGSGGSGGSSGGCSC